MSDEKEYRGDGSGAWSRMKLTTNYSEEKVQGDKQQPLDSTSSSLGGLHRWGQVPCPRAFRINSGDQRIPHLSSLSPLRTQLASSSPANFQALPLVVKSASFAAMNQEKDTLLSDEFLLEEIRKRRIQVYSCPFSLRSNFCSLYLPLTVFRGGINCLSVSLSLTLTNSHTTQTKQSNNNWSVP